ETAQILRAHALIQAHQAGAGGDHQGAGALRPRPTKPVRVSELSAKVQAAREGKDVPQARAERGLQLAGQVKLGLRPQKQFGAIPRAIGGREQENARACRRPAVAQTSGRGASHGVASEHLSREGAFTYDGQVRDTTWLRLSSWKANSGPPSTELF